MMPSAGIWESIFKPLPASSAATPALAILRLVTPLSIIACAFAPQPLSNYLLILAAAPVGVALFQILIFTIFMPHLLHSEPHIENRAKMDNRFGSKDGRGPKDAKLARRSPMSDNPAVHNVSKNTNLLEGGE